VTALSVVPHHGLALAWRLKRRRRRHFRLKKDSGHMAAAVRHVRTDGVSAGCDAPWHVQSRTVTVLAVSLPSANSFPTSICIDLASRFQVHLFLFVFSISIVLYNVSLACAMGAPTCRAVSRTGLHLDDRSSASCCFARTKSIHVDLSFTCGLPRSPDRPIGLD
jgi:hypothetical protein